MRKGDMSKLGLVARGLAMGVAEVIPGVSGGTIAFITGIYEELIQSIKAVGPEAVNGWKAGGVKGLWLAVNGDFLLWLLTGMAVGLGVGVFGVTYLMEVYPEPLWAFFFGLILASAIYIAKQIEHWNATKLVAIVVGAAVAYGITTISPAEGSLSPVYVFCSGTIAISALMLPGISGSFMLLIMGMYTLIIPLLKDTLRTFDPAGLSTIAIFVAGCLVGMVTFSRLLSWLFQKYKHVTFAVLTGFLIGALSKVWPWRSITAVLDKDTGTIVSISDQSQLLQMGKDGYKVLSEVNTAPDAYLLPCVVLFAVGIGLVFLLDRLDASH